MTESSQSQESTVLYLNKKAMDHLRLNQFEQAFFHLNEAEKIIKTHDLDNQMWAVTMNNYGCYYKKQGKLQEALSCLTLALSKEKSLKNDAVNKAATHLNISSIFSSLQIYESALDHSQKALKILKLSQDTSLNAITTQVVAYHTVGVELEHLYRHLEAMHMYKDGWELAKANLSDSHPLALKLKKNLNLISSSMEPIRPSRGIRTVSKKARTSKTRLSYRKTPSYAPRETFPLITYERNTNSFSEARKNKKIIQSQEKNFPGQFLPVPKRKRVQGIDSKKIENLRSLIEEIESSIKSNHETIKIKAKTKLLPQTKSSIGVQVDEVSHSWGRKVENLGMSEVASLDQINLERKSKTSHRNRALQRIKGQDAKFAEMQVKDAIKEVKMMNQFKESSLENELMPVPRSMKVEMFKPANLSTIYESKYEDQRDCIILIQSFIRMHLQRKKYKKIQTSATTIQRHMKSWMTQKLFKRILNAVIFIQSFFRGHRVRKLYKFLLPN